MRERLDYEAFLRIISRYLRTQAGKETLKGLSPLPPEQAKVRLGLLREAQRLREEGRSPPLGDLPDASAALQKAQIGALLRGPELLDIAELVQVGARVFDAVEELGIVPDPYYLLPLARQIKRAFSPDGELLDTASPRLAELRQAWRRQRAKVVGMMAEAARRYRGVLRAEEPTIKGGRMVLQVASHASVPGVVHGYSRTTETLFVEPSEVIPEQNKLVRLEEEIEDEVKRILAEFSQRVHLNAGFLRELWEALGLLDLLWASLEYMEEVRGTIPQIQEHQGITLKEGRHPVLLDLKGEAETVPLTLEAGPAVRGVVFTGPNAGGKTVALKTMALAYLAAASGLPFPAKELRVWVPRKFFALGFEEAQSVEEGKSSFTALLEEIKELLAEADAETVAFFDEVLSSTDPTEGGALAFAILKELQKRGALSYSTTHLTVLKRLAARDPDFLTAAAQLDAEGKPTYRFRLGEVGDSYALEAARRWGLPAGVVDLAEEVLESWEQEMRQLKLELRARIRELERQKARYDEALKNAQREAERLVRAAKAEARRIVQEARKEVEEILREIRQSQSAKKAREARQTLKAAERALDERFKRKPSKLEPGKRYRIAPFGVVGELLEIRGRKAKLRVGLATLEVDAEALYEADGQGDS